jgi:hypothetical protein
MAVLLYEIEARRPTSVRRGEFALKDQDRFGLAISRRGPDRSDRKDSTRASKRQEAAALRDFNPAYVGLGSIASKMIRVSEQRMSGMPRKRTQIQACRGCREAVGNTVKRSPSSRRRRPSLAQ